MTSNNYCCDKLNGLVETQNEKGAKTLETVIPACIIFMADWGSVGETEASERNAAEMRSFRQEVSLPALSISYTDVRPLPQRLKQPVAKLYCLQWERKSTISLSMTMSKG